MRLKGVWLRDREGDASPWHLWVAITELFHENQKVTEIFDKYNIMQMTIHEKAKGKAVAKPYFTKELNDIIQQAYKYHQYDRCMGIYYEHLVLAIVKCPSQVREDLQEFLGDKFPDFIKEIEGAAKNPEQQ
ncbi:MAG: hypothetical protein M1338_03875 [Patescibacteria group bacterium]|nr:hypothetical protein [Patescibacteria group bacterium]